LLDKAAEKVAWEANRVADINAGKLNAPYLTQALITAGVLKEGETL
jgi:hypothetical protein